MYYAWKNGAFQKMEATEKHWKEMVEIKITDGHFLQLIAWSKKELVEVMSGQWVEKGIATTKTA
jgi:hypothetical protein